MPVKIIGIPLLQGDTFTIRSTTDKVTVEVTSTSVENPLENDTFYNWVLSVCNDINKLKDSRNCDYNIPVKPPVSTYLLVDRLNKAYSLKCRKLGIILINNKDGGYDYNYYIDGISIGETVTVKRMSPDNRTMYSVSFKRCEVGWWAYAPLLINICAKAIDQPTKNAGMFRVWLSKQNRWIEDIPVQEALVFKEEGYVVQRMNIAYTTPPA